MNAACLTPGNAAHGFEGLFEEAAARGVASARRSGQFVELVAGRLHLQCQHMVGIETGIDGEQPLHAVQQKAGADEEHEGQSDCGDDEARGG